MSTVVGIDDIFNDIVNGFIGLEVLLQFLFEFGYWESKEVIQVNTQP